MLRFDRNDLSGMSRFYRANLINCLSGTKPALLIGTVSGTGITNLALFSSVVHLGADPALIGFIQRPITELSHTYKNIIETGCFTVNHVVRADVAKAHHTSAKFPDGQSEFEKCGFKEEFIAAFSAPFVADSPVKFGMNFIREIPLPENGTRLMIGEIAVVMVQENILQEDGNLDLENADSAGVVGLETYHRIGKIGKFAYAKADVPPTQAS